MLVTGACGSVGSAMVDRLLQEGYKVCAFDNNENGLFQIRSKFLKYIETSSDCSLGIFVM